MSAKGIPMFARLAGSCLASLTVILGIAAGPALADPPIATPTSSPAATPTIDQVARQHPEATKVSATSLSWNNGSVVMVWPGSSNPQTASSSSAAVTPQATLDGCPQGWACFYENANYGGRRLQFQDRGCQSLAAYGFDNMTTSWHFNKTGELYVYDGSGCKGALLHCHKIR